MKVTDKYPYNKATIFTLNYIGSPKILESLICAALPLDSHARDHLDNASMAAGKSAVLFDDIIQAGELLSC